MQMLVLVNIILPTISNDPKLLHSRNDSIRYDKTHAVHSVGFLYYGNDSAIVRKAEHLP